MNGKRGLTLGLGILMGAGLVCGVAAANAPVNLPACPTEDSDNCYWDATLMGDGNGRSFDAIDGQVYYWDERDTADPGPEPEPIYGNEFRTVGPLCDGGKAVTREEQRTWSTPYSLVDGKWVILGDKEFTNWHLIDEKVEDSAECAAESAPAEPAPAEPSPEPVTETPSQQKLDWDTDTLECGVNAKPAIDQDQYGNWWAYCEPALVEG